LRYVIKNIDKYNALGVVPIGGILLYEDSGVGKTLMVNCFIKESVIKAFICRKNKPDGEFVNEIKKVFTDDGKYEVIVSASPNAMEYWAMQYLNYVEIKTPSTLREKIKNNLQKAEEKYK